MSKLPLNQSKRQMSKPDYLDTTNIPLPKIIRYYDELAEKDRSVRTKDNVWNVITDGKTCSVDWIVYSSNERDFLKKFFSWSYGHWDPSSVLTFLAVARAHPKSVSHWLEHISDQANAQRTWETHGYNQLRVDVALLLRAISKFMCELSLCGWSPDDSEYLRGWKWFNLKNQTSDEHFHSYYLTNDDVPIAL